MKKILIGILVLVSVLTIYLLLKDKKIYYVCISDITFKDKKTGYGFNNYVEDYLYESNTFEDFSEILNSNNRIIDIIRIIEDNSELEQKTMQNILIKADILTLAIGYNDLISKITYYNNYELYDMVDSYVEDLEKLFNILRIYDKENIIFLGYFNCYDSKYDNIIRYINNRVKTICNKYHIEFVDISFIKDYYVEDNINIEGQHLIFDKIREVIDNNIKNK